MQSNSISKHSLLIYPIIGIILFGVILGYLILDIPVEGFSTKLTLSLSGEVKKNFTSSLPVRIKIPTIKIDAFLERVGLTTNGSVDVPKGGINAARYQLGPRPGDVGNAIIVGHYGTWKTGKGSVFDRLHELKKGNKIFVENASGVMISFIVTTTKTYLPTAIVPEIFISTDGKSHLNLITCDGAWNKITKHYPNRLVVFTDKE